MAQQDNMFTTKLRKTGIKLIHVKPTDLVVYKEFVKNLEEGQLVDVFFDANQDDGTLSQLAKVHKCCRILAKEIGYTFEEMKLEIKKKAGFCTKKKIGKENYVFVRSFGDASVTDLGLAIQAIIEIGDTVGINFR
jgi:hypothetical protein